MAESAQHSPAEGVTPTTEISKGDPLQNFEDHQAVPAKKILFLGDPSIGKTTFIQKYCEQLANHHRCYVYNDNRLVLKQFFIRHQENDEITLIQLMDLSSGITEESRKDQYPNEVDFIVLCFAIDNPTSLDNVWKIWLPEHQRKYPDFRLFYLLGLRNDTRRKLLEENKKLVTLEKGSQIHQKYNFLGEYMECSVVEDPQQAFDLMETVISDLVGYVPV